MSDFGLLVFAEDFEAFGEGGDGVDGLAVSCVVGEDEVGVEHVLPFLSDDGEGLDFGEVEFVETQDAEHLAERALLVW